MNAAHKAHQMPIVPIVRGHWTDVRENVYLASRKVLLMNKLCITAAADPAAVAVGTCSLDMIVVVVAGILVLG